MTNSPKIDLKLVGFGFNMNIMLQHPPSRAYGPIPVHVESQSLLWTFFKSINGEIRKERVRTHDLLLNQALIPC